LRVSDVALTPSLCNSGNINDINSATLQQWPLQHVYVSVAPSLSLLWSFFSFTSATSADVLDLLALHSFISAMRLKLLI